MKLKDIKLINSEDTIEIKEEVLEDFHVTLYEVPVVKNDVKGRADEVIWNNTKGALLLKRLAVLTMVGSMNGYMVIRL